MDDYAAEIPGISREILAGDVAMDTAGSGERGDCPVTHYPFFYECAPLDRKCQYPLSLRPRCAPCYSEQPCMRFPIPLPLPSL